MSTNFIFLNHHQVRCNYIACGNADMPSIYFMNYVHFTWTPDWSILCMVVFRTDMFCYTMLGPTTLRWKPHQSRVMFLFMQNFQMHFHHFAFWFKFHWSLFLGFLLTIGQHWLRLWLGAKQVTSHYLNQCWPNSLMYICVTRGRWVMCLSSKWNSHKPSTRNAT